MAKSTDMKAEAGADFDGLRNEPWRRWLRSTVADHGGSTAVSRLSGIPKKTLDNHLFGYTKKANLALLQRVADTCGVAMRWPDAPTSDAPSPDSSVPNLSEPDLRSPKAARSTPRPPTRPALDIPVYGTAAGARAGSAIWSGEVIEWLPRPPGLRTVRDAYALYVSGDSMRPRYATGDLIFVAPHRPVRPGDIVVVQTAADSGGEMLAWLKEFAGRRGGDILARQYNEAAEIVFEAPTVLALHRVLTVNELFGL